MTFDDISRWARGEGLEIVLLLTGGVLAARLIRWVGDRVISRIDAESSPDEAEPLVRSERAKHLHAAAEVTRWVIIVLLYFVIGLLVLRRLGVPLTGLAAPAAVVGVALGFGAQQVVQDILSGFFLILERQYGYGDLVRISEPGSTTGVAGTVEELTLRTTRLRTIDGELLIIPNGEIRQVTNLSREWARAVIDVPIALGSDINQISGILREVGEAAFADKELGALLLDAPSVMGVEAIDVGYLTIRVVARTLPGKQFDVGRLLRSRIATALQDAGIEMAQAFLSTAQPGTG